MFVLQLPLENTSENTQNLHAINQNLSMRVFVTYDTSTVPQL